MYYRACKSIAAFLALCSTASAADLDRTYPLMSLKDPVPLPSDIFSGFYLGGHIGGAGSTADLLDRFYYEGDPESKGALEKTGLIAGGQVGYNIRRGNFVFGLEGDIGHLALSAKKSASSNPASCTGTYTTAPFSVDYASEYCNVDAKYAVSSDLYGDLTARVGYAMNRTLFYAKGGAAFLNAEFTANYAGGNCTFDYSCGGHTNVPSTFKFGHSETLAGWTVGAGVEYALSRSWSLKAEYQHFDFGSMSFGYSGTYAISGYDHTGGHYTSTINGKTNVSVTDDAVTVGVNYHLPN